MITALIRTEIDSPLDGVRPDFSFLGTGPIAALLGLVILGCIVMMILSAARMHHALNSSHDPVAHARSHQTFNRALISGSIVAAVGIALIIYT